MCFGNSATKPYVAARACEWLADGFSRRVFCLPWILVSRKYCEKASWSLPKSHISCLSQPQERNAGRCRLRKLRKSSKTLANTPHRPLRCFAAADAQFWCSFALQKSQHQTAKDYQSERWMPVISTSSLEKRARPTIWDSSGYLSQISTLLKKLFWNREFCRFNERQLVNSEIFWSSIPHNSFSTLFWKKMLWRFRNSFFQHPFDHHTMASHKLHVIVMTPKQNYTYTNMPWEDPLHPLGPHHSDSGNFDQKISHSTSCISRGWIAKNLVGWFIDS